MLFFLAFLIMGCSSTPPTPATTVTFMVFGDPAEQAAFQSVIDGFHQTNANIRVNFTALPSKSDYITRLTSDFAAGAPPDVFLLNYRRLAQFHNRDALEPLGPKLVAHPDLGLDQYYPISIEAFTDSSNTLVCIPQNISSQVVYYNTDIFDADGIPYPASDWTWAEFRETAIVLTKPDQNQDGEPDQYGLGLEPRILRVAPFIWQNQGELVDNVASPTRLALDSPAATEAIEFMTALSLQDQVVPNLNAEIVQTHGDRFLTGNMAMYVNSRRIVPILREVVDFNWDVAPLPVGKQPASVLHSDGYCMAAASEVKEAAWEFVAFAIGPEGQRLASRAGRTVPSLIDVSKTEAFLDPTKPPANAQVWLDITPHLRLLPRLENWPEIERTAGIELELTYIGRQPLGITINNVQRVAETGFATLD